MTELDRIDAAAAFLRARLDATPKAALVLGSGLGAFADTLTSSTSVAYGDIPYWPAAAVIGHAGRLVAGIARGRRVLALAGRLHAYEGHDLRAVTFAVRVIGRLGTPVLVLTNAAGGINPRFSAGTLMAIDDHLNLMGVHPLVGPNLDPLGPRFPDMSEVYSRRLRAIADEAAAAEGVPLEHGVYAAVIGPSYETPAEIRAFRTLGADAVGMSTVPEALVARHMGLEVLGLSCIANMAAGMQPVPLSAEDVLATAARVQRPFGRLLEGIVERL